MPATTQPHPGKKIIKVPKVVNGVPSEVEIEVDDVAGPTWGANDQHRLLNTKLRRADGPAKSTGTAIYTQDVHLPGMLFGRFVCSPFAHATVKKIDTSAAERMKGVKYVKQFATEVRYEGEPLVAIAATTLEAAEDAVKAVVIEWDVLPHVVTADDAMKPGAQTVFPPDRQRPGRGGGGQGRGNADQVTAQLENCDAVITAEYRTKIVHHCCLETHSICCDYRGGNTATVYASTQGTHSIPGDSARILDLDESNVTSIVQNMGGGFGSKFGIGIAGQWACRMSKELSVPVKVMLTRRDEFLTAGNGP
jgi:xanthine dehydrogenase YagR molybdenum-binding subunit